MKKCIVVLAVVGVIVLGLAVGVFAAELAWQDIARGILDVKSVLVNPDNPQIIYIGSRDGVFKSEDGGESWRNIFSARGTNRGVNFLLFAFGDKNSLYAATGNGLYFSSNRGRNWSRVFKGKNSLENECTALVVLPHGIYLGTKGGLFASRDGGRLWHKEAGRIGNSRILSISYNSGDPDYIYVASVDGVFKSKDKGQSWERVFVVHPVENGVDTEKIEEDLDEETRYSSIRCLSLDPNNPSHLYLASNKGLYRSRNKGEAWDLMPDYGLLNRDISFLLISGVSDIYAVTKSGIFIYRGESWEELSFGLVAGEVRFLALDDKAGLYAVCEKGLFKLNIKDVNSRKAENIAALYNKDEPKIEEIQQAAIRYAEVDPEKIRQWRNKAAKKALLPQVNIGLDRNTSDLWHWETGSTTRTDDDVLRRGHDSIDWGVSLSWDLSEIIWNNDQTSIDTRSRLMVQLRDDILDEVTKLYFERLRVKMELDSLPIEDRKKRFEKELRLQELTASIDALTGGYFSQQVKIKNKKISS